MRKQQAEDAKDKSKTLLADKPEMTTKLAILLRAGLIHHTPSKKEGVWYAKVSTGIGAVDFISDEIITSDGEAFQYSGRQFDKMGKAAFGSKDALAGGQRKIG